MVACIMALAHVRRRPMCAWGAKQDGPHLLYALGPVSSSYSSTARPIDMRGDSTADGPTPSFKSQRVEKTIPKRQGAPSTPSAARGGNPNPGTSMPVLFILWPKSGFGREAWTSY